MRSYFVPALAATARIKVVDWAEMKIRRTLFSQAAQYLTGLEAPTSSASLARYGTAYGGRLIDENKAKATISQGSYVFSAGAGEDISFDIDLQRRFGCHIIIADPTPRAIRHFESLVHASRHGQRLAIDHSRDLYYDLNNVDLQRIHLAPFAVWNENTTLKLWAPAKSQHVSHSVSNLQRTNVYIDVPARRVVDIMANYKVKNIPLVKLDIMGSECNVIRDLIECKIFPYQLSVKFYTMYKPDRATSTAIRDVVSQLMDSGYELIHFDGAITSLFRLASSRPRDVVRSNKGTACMEV